MFDGVLKSITSRQGAGLWALVKLYRQLHAKPHKYDPLYEKKKGTLYKQLEKLADTKQGQFI